MTCFATYHNISALVGGFVIGFVVVGGAIFVGAFLRAAWLDRQSMK